MKNKSNLSLWVLTYPTGIVLGILFYILKLLGSVEVKNWKRFPEWKGNLIIVSNHPSLWEPMLLPPLLFKQYLVNPVKYGPWNIPDKGNYYDKWYCALVKSRFIPIERGNKKAEVRALHQMVAVLKSGEIIILFPEGGRTVKGEKFLFSRKGNQIRELQNGVGILVKKTGATIVPVWVQGAEKVLPIGKKIPRFWKKTIIKIGEPIIIDENRRNNITGTTELVSKRLLKLADKEE